ncbi:hypothetical protein GGX14DRAFT_560156 [Mycena pura]|uniref:Uncharacterized protein n=1 Tax=Mycena pura TaxID=153505 RepID=A0AAD6VR90_9AGAR|nr:hypothetical protein GGX14DRAFT_560156 [Mycena pura]
MKIPAAISRRTLSTLISKIEIKRKFLPGLFPMYLKEPHGVVTVKVPTFVMYTRPGAVQFIRDIYYDRHDALLTAKKGLWVRRRSVFNVGCGTGPCTASWEAKVRLGGNVVAPQFTKVKGTESVKREIERALGGGHVAVDNIDEHLVVMCDFTTRRTHGQVECAYDDNHPYDAGRPLENRYLDVTIDQIVETASSFEGARAVLEGLPDGGERRDVDFFYNEIGELGLTEEICHTEVAALGPNEAQKHRDETVRKALVAELEEFMSTHEGVFPMMIPTTPPLRLRETLPAYFAWKQKERAAAGLWARSEELGYR